jgi:hypothetical protein
MTEQSRTPLHTSRDHVRLMPASSIFSQELDNLLIEVSGGFIVDQQQRSHNLATSMDLSNFSVSPLTHL